MNKFSSHYGMIGVVDEAAWERGDFWVPVFICAVRHLICRNDLVEE